MSSEAVRQSLLRGAGLAGISEAVTRVTRIVTAIALARSMTVAEFGIAAAVLTVHELTRMFIQNGLGTRIVAANDAELPSIASTVYWMNWGLSALLFVFQIAIAVPAAHYFDANAMIAPIIALAFIHIVYPFSMIQVYLAQRSGHWGRVLGATAVQSGADALLTALFAFLGFGIWSVVLPRIILALAWTVFHYSATPWCDRLPFDPTAARRLSRYAFGILGVELLAALRLHGDKAIIGALLGPSALGLYAFAANIGNGITASLSQSLGAVILPFLRHGNEKGNLRQSYFKSLGLMLGMTLPLALAQAVLAPWYVPMLFGEKWVPAVPVLIVLSLASLSRPMLVTTSQMLRTAHLAGQDFKLGVAATILFFAGLCGGLAAGGILQATLGSTAGLFAGSLLAFIAGCRHTRQKPALAPEAQPFAADAAVCEIPKVTVVIACYNAAPTIAQTVRSVQAQTLSNWELLVVDDGSRDNSRAIVQALAAAEPRIRLISQANAGPSAARNRGTHEARGSYVAFIDADDLWSPEHLALTVSALDADGALGLCFGGCRILSQSGAPTGRHSRLWTHGVTKRDVLASNPSCTCSSLVVRKQVFATAGLFRDDMKYAEDQEWLYRVLSAGWHIRSLDMHTVGYRTTDGGLSSQVEKMRDGWLHFMSILRAHDPAFAAQHFALAAASMEIYFAQRALTMRDNGAVNWPRLGRAIAAHPKILFYAPRKLAGLGLALLKSKSSILPLKYIEASRHV